MNALPSVLIKLSGELFKDAAGALTAVTAQRLIGEINELTATHHVGIVIGGGNFFRGSIQGKQLGLRPQAGHAVGMHATVLNGLILQELLQQAGLITYLVSPTRMHGTTQAIEPDILQEARERRGIIIFVGGSGNPFFTTDTTAIIRGLQIGATLILKATNIDGVYTRDPRKHPDAQYLPRLSYAYALEHKLGIMDATALTLASEHQLTIRVFSMNAPAALSQALHNEQFGSTILHHTERIT